MGRASVLKIITEPRDFPGVILRYLAINFTNSFSITKSSGVTRDEESSIKITSAVKSYGPRAAVSLLGKKQYMDTSELLKKPFTVFSIVFVRLGLKENLI